MSVGIEVLIDKSSIERIVRELTTSIAIKAENFLVAGLNNMPALRKWINFVDTVDFFGEFGVEGANQSSIRERVFDGLFKTSVKIEGASIIIKAIDQDFLRAATTTIWTSKKRPSITVNAWNIYEYGTQPTIDGYRFRSMGGGGRSGLGIMEPSDSSFSFFDNSLAPKPFEVRSQVEAFASTIVGKIKLR